MSSIAGYVLVLLIGGTQIEIRSNPALSAKECVQAGEAWKASPRVRKTDDYWCKPAGLPTITSNRR